VLVLAAVNLERFVGTWKLVSFETRGEDGEVAYPFGKDALGYIMYSADDYMSVTVLPKNRRRFNTQDILGGTIEEKVTAAESYISYFGRYEVIQDRVIHHVEASFFPNWVGVDQERFYRFDGNRLTLSAAPMLINGKSQSAHLIWDKS
jgi:hypothetical protein